MDTLVALKWVWQEAWIITIKDWKKDTHTDSSSATRQARKLHQTLAKSRESLKSWISQVFFSLSHTEADSQWKKFHPEKHEMEVSEGAGGASAIKKFAILCACSGRVMSFRRTPHRASRFASKYTTKKLGIPCSDPNPETNYPSSPCLWPKFAHPLC